MTVNLEFDEWQRVLALMAKGPWEVANPLIMKIGEQLRMQTPAPAAGAARPNGPTAMHGEPEEVRSRQ